MRTLTKEEEDLVLREISERLTFGVDIVEVIDDNGTVNLGNPHRVKVVNLDQRTIGYDSELEYIHYYRHPERIKIVLRSKSDMTHEELEEWVRLRTDVEVNYKIGHDAVVDFYKEHGFDYRGLLDEELAVDKEKVEYAKSIDDAMPKKEDLVKETIKINKNMEKIEQNNKSAHAMSEIKTKGFKFTD